MNINMNMNMSTMAKQSKIISIIRMMLLLETEIDQTHGNIYNNKPKRCRNFYNTNKMKHESIA